MTCSTKAVTTAGWLLGVAMILSGCTIEGRAGRPAQPPYAANGNPPPYAQPPPAPPPTAVGAPNDRLSGNVDVRPFTAHVAYAWRQGGQRLDITAFDRPVSREVGCLSGEQGLVDTQRTIWIQMDWPAPVGSVWSSTVPTSNPNTAGVFFTVRRGLGGSGQRASGDVRVVEVGDKTGVLSIDAATSNKVGGVHGSVRGTLPFTICN